MNPSNQKSQQDSIRAACFLKDIPRMEFTEEAAMAQTICERFDEVVKRFPQNVALKSRSRNLRYSELDSQTNGIAQYLLGLGLDRHERIGLLFEHSALGIIAQIGVLKAGATRVDLSISFPVQRLKQIIQLCGIRYLITRTSNLELAESLVSESTVLINLDDREIPRHGENPRLPLNSNTPVTISYSSGSTGKPKQMIRDHLNELHSIMRVTNSIGMNSEDRMVFTTGGLAIPFHALAHGACYYPTDLGLDGNLVALANWIREERITVFRTPVSTFRALSWSLRNTDEFPDLRLVVLQGEPVYRADVEAFKKRCPDQCVLVSTLGVSEFGDFAHFLVDKNTEITTPTVPGGYALEGVEVALLDAVEDSGTNEIGLRGSFISHSISSRITRLPQSVGAESSIPTFTTGDTGEMGEDGCIYHTGRKDYQVKVRGNRVDLLAVEAALLDLDEIPHTAAASHTDANGDVSLVAYIESKPIDTKSIQEKLRETLPAYMVPTIIICLDKLPRTLTGKIDRKSLPAPSANILVSPAEGEAEDVSELTGVAREMMVIWKEILQLDHIGLDDHFLDIGGDSLKAMRVLAQINHKFNVDLRVRTLFDSGSIAELSGVVESLLPESS